MRTINLVNIEIIKIRLRIKKCEELGIFSHREFDESLKNLIEIRELLILVLGGGTHESNWENQL